MHNDNNDNTNESGFIGYEFEQFRSFIHRLNLCGCFGRYRTPGDELRDIAESLINSNSVDSNSSDSNSVDSSDSNSVDSNIQPIIYNNEIDVKIRLSKDHFIAQVMIKYNNENTYINIPYFDFEPDKNPNIKNILDTFFDADFNKPITAKNSLFDKLEEYYQNSHHENNKTSDWFRSKAEWIKFSYINNQITPCGFKRFQKFKTSEN